MIEYEIPLVCLIFTSLITIIFFIKEKIELEENYYFKHVLIFTLLVNVSNLWDSVQLKSYNPSFINRYNNIMKCFIQ